MGAAGSNEQLLLGSKAPVLRPGKAGGRGKRSAFCCGSIPGKHTGCLHMAWENGSFGYEGRGVEDNMKAAERQQRGGLLTSILHSWQSRMALVYLKLKVPGSRDPSSARFGRSWARRQGCRPALSAVNAQLGNITVPYHAARVYTADTHSLPSCQGQARGLRAAYQNEAGTVLQPQLGGVRTQGDVHNRRLSIRAHYVNHI
jgi:hypothetical protein